MFKNLILFFIKIEICDWLRSKIVKIERLYDCKWAVFTITQSFNPTIRIFQENKW